MSLSSYTKRLLICLATLTSIQGFAYQVQPMVAELQTVGNRSSITYRVINPSETSLPIEVEVYKRSFDAEQKEILTLEEEDFIVLPPQIEVPANGYQVFRAQYIGDGELDSTQSYRIIFKQLPLESEGTESQVNMIFNFATLVFVSPPDSKGELKQEVKCETEDACALNIVNTGNQVVNLVQSALHINGEMNKDWQWVQAQIPVTFLMPDHTLHIPLAEIASETENLQSASLVTANNAK